MSKKKNKSIVETKEDKAIGTWMPIGVMIGTVVGCILSFKYDDMMFIGYGSVGGLLLVTIVRSILLEGDIKIYKDKQNQKERQKRNKI